MSVIDERIVEMQFDNAQFEKNIHQSITSLDELKKSLDLDKSAKDVSDFQNNINRINLSGFTSAISGVVNNLNASTVALYSTIDHFVKNILSRAQKLIKSLSGIEMINAGWEKFAEKTSAVQVIMSATRKQVGLLFESEEQQMAVVDEMMSQLNRFSDETSYSFTDMANNIGKFTSVGVGLKDAQVAMQGIATWGASAGRTPMEVSRAMYQLSQAMGSGAMKLMDWKSIETLTMGTVEFKQAAMDAAVAAGTLTTKIQNGEKVYYTKTGHMKVTTENFRDTLVKGWFTAPVMTAVFKQYGDFSDKLMTSIETLKADGASQMLGFIDLWKEDASKLEEIAKELKQPVDKVEEEFYRLTSFSGSDNTEEVLSKYGERYKMQVSDLSEWVSSYMENPNSFGKEQWNQLAELTGQKVGQLKKDFNAMKKSIKVNTMDSYAKKFGMSVSELGKAYAQYKEGTLDFEALSKETDITVKQLQKDFAEMAKTDMELGRATFDKSREAKTLKEALVATKDAVSTGWMNIFQAIFGNYLEAKELWTGVSDALWTAFAGQFKNIRRQLEDIFKPFRKMKGPEKIVNAFQNLADVVNSINEVFVNSLLGTLLPKSADEMITFADKFEALTEKIKSFIDPENSQFLKILGDSLSIVFNIIAKVGGFATNIIGTFAKFIGSLFTGFDAKNGNKLADFLHNISEAIKNFEIPESIKSGFSSFLETIGKVLGVFGNIGVKVFGVIKTIASAAWKLLSPLLKNFLNLLDGLADQLNAALSGKDLSLEGIFKSLFKNTKNFDKVKNWAKQLFDGIKTAFSSGIDGISKWLESKGQIFNKAPLYIFSLFTGKNNKQKIQKEMVTELTKKGGLFSNITSIFGNLFGSGTRGKGGGGLTSIIGSISEKAKGFIGKLKDSPVFQSIGQFIGKIIAAFRNISIEDVNYVRQLILEVIRVFYTIKGLLLALQAIKTASEGMKNVVSITEKFANIGQTISDTIGKIPGVLTHAIDSAKETATQAIKSWQKVEIAKAIPGILKALAILIGTIVAAAVIFTYIDHDKLEEGLKYLMWLGIGIAAFLVLIVVLIKVLTSKKGLPAVSEGTEELKGMFSGQHVFLELAAMLVGLAIVIGVIAKSISRLGQLDPAQFQRGALTIGIFLLILGGMFALIYSSTLKGSSTALDQAVQSFNKIAGAFAKIALSILAIGLAVALIGALPLLMLVKGIAVLAIIAVIITFMTIFNNITTKVGANSNAADTIVAMSKGLLFAALAIILLGAFGPNDFNKALDIILEISILLAAMVIIFKMMSNMQSMMLPEQIKQINKTIRMFSLVLLTIAISLIGLNKFGPKVEDIGKYVNVLIKVLFLMFIGLAILMDTIKWLDPESIKNVGKAMTNVASTLLIAAIAILIMSKIPWNEAENMGTRIGVLAAFFVGMFLVLNTLIKNSQKSSPEKIMALGRTMMMFSGVLIIITLVMMMLAVFPINMKSLTPKLIGLGALFALLGFVLFAMAKWTSATPKKLNAVATSLLMMSGVFVVIIIVMNVLSKIPWTSTMSTKIWFMLGMVGLLGLIMWAIVSMKNATPARLAAVSSSFVSMSLIFFVIAGAFAALQLIKIDKDFTKKLVGLLVSIGLLGGILVALTAIQKVGSLFKSVAALLLVVGALYAVIGAMKILETIPVTVILLAVGVIAVLVGALILLGALGATGVGAVGMLAAAAAMMMLSMAVVALSVAAIGFGAAALLFVNSIALLGEAWSKNGDSIKEAVQSIIDILPELGTAFGQMFANCFIALAEGFVQFLKIITDNRQLIVDSLYILGIAAIEGFSRALMEGSWMLSEAVVQAILAICVTIVDYADLIVLTFQGAIVKAVNGIIELNYLFRSAAIGLAMGFAGGFLKAIGEKLSDTALGKAFGIGNNWVEMGQNLIDKGKLELPDGFEAAYEQAKKIADGYKNGKDEAASGASEVGEAVKTAFNDALTNNSNGDILGGLLGGLGGGEGESEAGGIAGRFKSAIMNGLGGENGIDLSSVINIDGLTSEGGPLDSIKSSLTSGLTEAGSESGSAGGEAIKGGLLESFSGSTGISTEEITSKFKGMINTEEFSEGGTVAGDNYVLKIAGSFESPPKELDESISKLSTKVTTELSSKKKDMKTAGADFMSGLKQGIDQGESSVLTAVRDLAAKIKQKVHEGLQNGSPSRYTRKQGRFFDQGLALGIIDGTAEVMDASEELTSKVTNAFSSALSSAYDLLDSNLEAGPVIRPVVDLSDVNSKSKSLSSIFDKSVTTSVNLANSVGPRAAASIANRQNASANASNTQSNNVTLYIDGIKYNTDDYIDSSITGFVENMIRRGQMYGRA